MPGPRPTPTKKLEARGSWLAKTRGGEPTPPEGESECPTWVIGPAREYWKTIEPMLSGMGIMSPAYTAPLGMLANSLGRYLEYEQKVSECGPVSITENGNEIVSPWWAARNKAWDQVMRAFREFGLTPAAATSIRVPGHEAKKDGIAGLINPKLVG